MFAVVLGGGEHLLGVVPSHIGEDAVLDVTSEQSLLGEWDGKLLGIQSPSVHPSEEERAGLSLNDLFIKIVLEELLGFGFHFIK